MELSWLEDFVAVARLRSFSKAAVTRHATQSALSRRIKALEAWYGVPLVDRSTYPVALTEAGARFVPVCEQLVADLYRSRREARAEAGDAGRTLRFAMPHSLAVTFFPEWWRRERGNAELTAKVVAADLTECVELLLKGACQFLLHYSSEAVPDRLENVNLRRRHVGTERLVPVSRTGRGGKPLFDFPARQSSRPSARAVPLLTYASDSFLGMVTARLHAQLEARCTLVQRYESSLVEALKAQALLGEGVAWLPERSVRSEVAAGTLRVIGDETLAVPLGVWLCTPASASVPTHAQSLLEPEGVPRAA